MNIAGHHSMIAGKRLPYDAESEYLESAGNAYAVVPNNIFSKHTGLRVELTLSTGSATLSAVSVLLAAGGDIQGPPYYYRVAIDKTAQFASPGVNWFSLFTDGNVHTVSTTNVNLTNTGIYTNTDVDGTRVLSGSFSNANKTFDDTVGIFAFNNGNNKCPAGIRIYSIVAFDENGNKTADFIPVRKGTVGYLYDRVSGKLFGNAGTGDFVLGPDVVPVEYLQSSGTQWIDTGVIPTAADSFYCRIRQSVVADQCLWGLAGVAYCFSNWTGVGSGNGTHWGHPAIGTGGVQGVNPLGDTNWHEILCQPSGIFVDGVQINTQVTAPTQSPLNTVALFARSVNSAGGGVAKYGRGRMSAFKVERNGDPLRKYFPVRVGTEGAMMDTLTRRIYRNAGTGAFGYGNDLKYPIPAE